MSVNDEGKRKRVRTAQHLVRPSTLQVYRCTECGREVKYKTMMHALNGRTDATGHVHTFEFESREEKRSTSAPSSRDLLATIFSPGFTSPAGTRDNIFAAIASALDMLAVPLPTPTGSAPDSMDMDVGDDELGDYAFNAHTPGPSRADVLAASPSNEADGRRTAPRRRAIRAEFQRDAVSRASLDGSEGGRSSDADSIGDFGEVTPPPAPQIQEPTSDGPQFSIIMERHHDDDTASNDEREEDALSAQRSELLDEMRTLASITAPVRSMFHVCHDECDLVIIRIMLGHLDVHMYSCCLLTHRYVLRKSRLLERLLSHQNPCLARCSSRRV